jgi:protein-ribulosamine 3-kinase
MILPAPLREDVEAVMRAQIASASSVGGGCISETARIQLTTGQVLFLKWTSENKTSGLYREEAKGLQALRAASAVRVPDVLHLCDATGPHRYILLEWLEPGNGTKNSWAALGSAVARLHRVQHEEFGWSSNNFIGSLPQSNTPSASWPEFWREHRLRPQLEVAAAQFNHSQLSRLDKLIDDLEALIGIGDEEGASLVHGDLWSGNVHMLTDESAALIDPATYYGHREVDLAMSLLFGGFGAEFYEAYEQEWPLQKGANERMLVYQLYYLLVHVNLFGGSYVSGTLNAVKRLGY